MFNVDLMEAAIHKLAGQILNALPCSRLRKDHKTQARKTVQDSDDGLRTGLWAPRSLQRRTLLAFIVIYACAALSLGALAIYSKRNNGVSDANTHDHYLWTYGPTAIFTLLAVFFTRTEQRALQLQPWKSMSSGFQPSSKSVLLDYVSRWNVLALIKAAQNRHVLAALGISGSLLLQLITALSTGLFVLQDVQVVKHDVNLDIREEFGALNTTFWIPRDANEVTGDFRPTAIVLGLIGGYYTLPNGTTHSQAVQQFSLPLQSEESYTSMTATVDVFESKLECEPAALHGNWLHQGNDTQFIVVSASSASSKNCTDAVHHVADLGRMDRLISLGSMTVRCTEFPPDDNVQGNRFMFYIGSVVGIAEKPSVNATALLCYPRYEVYKAPVTINQAGNAEVLTSARESHSKMIPNVDPWALALAFERSTAAAGSLVYADTSKIQGGYKFGNVIPGVIWTMFRIVNPQTSVQDWSNITLVNSTLQEIWSSWSAQFAELQLKRTANRGIMGDLTTNQARIFIHTLPLWLVEAGLLTLICVSVGLISTCSTRFLPRDPMLLGGLSTIVAASGAFQAACKGAAYCSEGELCRSLEGSEFSTTTSQDDFAVQTPKFCINWRVPGAPRPAPSVLHPSVLQKPSERWWRPSGTSRVYIFGASLLVLSMIGLLEGLYQYSKQHSGLIDVSGPTSSLHFTWTTLPAIVTVIIAALVGMQYFAISTLHPYQRLKRGSASACNALFTHPFSDGRILSFIEAVRDRELAVLLPTAAVLFGYFLTIAISGLFTPQLVPSFDSISIQQNDWFDHDTAMSKKSPMQIELVTLGNLSYPRFTYETLAFPTLTPPANQTVGGVNMQLPAIQGVMNCSLLPPEEVITVNNTWYFGNWSDIAVIALRNSTCFSQLANLGGQPPYGPVCKGGPYGAGPHGGGTPYNETLQGHTAPGGLCDTMLNNSVSFSSYFASTGGGVTSFIQLPTSGYFGYIWSLGQQGVCPNYMAVLGQTVNHLVEDATIFTCSPFVNQSQVNATFTLPAMDIDLSAPPRVIEGSSGKFSPATTLHLMLEQKDPLNAFQQLQLPRTSRNEALGSFIDVLVHGSQGVPMSELSGSANADRFISASDRLYGVGMAQIMNENRHSLQPRETELPGISQSLIKYRLMQSPLSTRILEGLLAAILVCMLIAYFMVDTRRVLKNNPCSIAGMASLVVDSELLTKDIIPPGAEWLPDEDLMSQEVFGGRLYSLGWWPSTDDKKDPRFGVDVVQSNPAEET